METWSHTTSATFASSVSSGCVLPERLGRAGGNQNGGLLTAPVREAVFLFMMAFISAWQTYGYLQHRNSRWLCICDRDIHFVMSQ